MRLTSNIYIIVLNSKKNKYEYIYLEMRFEKCAIIHVILILTFSKFTYIVHKICQLKPKRKYLKLIGNKIFKF